DLLGVGGADGLGLLRPRPVGESVRVGGVGEEEDVDPHRHEHGHDEADEEQCRPHPAGRGRGDPRRHGRLGVTSAGRPQRAPPAARPPATMAPAQPSTSMPMAWSSDQSPAPMVPTAKAVTAIMATYSQPCPGRKMKKPLLRWAVTPATSITPMTMAAATGVNSPS